METLEKRVLYSADPIFAPLLDALIHPPEPQPDHQFLQPMETPLDLSLVSELVIVDVTHDELRTLYLALEDQYAGTTTQVVAFDAGEDPIEQLSLLLQQYSELDAIHLLSYGDDGQLQLGGHALGSNDLRANASIVSQWGEALSDTGDLLLYGCNLSASVEGQALASTFSTLMRADVASSDDITGHTSLGGDWDLEIEFGELETAQLLDQSIQDDWVGKLDIVTGLIAHYEFSGNADDSVGAGNGIEINAPAYTPAQVGDGIDLTTASQVATPYVLVTSGVAPTSAGGELTIGFWVEANSLGSLSTVLDKSSNSAGYEVKVTASGLIQVDVVASHTLVEVLQSNTAIVANQASHIAVSIGASTVNIYIDGVLDASRPISSFSEASANLLIGVDASVGQHLDGTLDDLRFYSRTLSAADVAELASVGAPPNTEEVVTRNAGVSLANGGSITLPHTILRTIDAEQSNSELVYTVYSTVPGFSWVVNGVPSGIGDTFTQQDINDGLVVIQHDGSAGTDSGLSNFIQLNVDDGFGTSTPILFSVEAAENLAPTDLVFVGSNNDLGLELNLNESNATYLKIQDASTLFGGLGAFTFETSIETASVNPGNATLIAYGANSTDKQFQIDLIESTGLLISISNQSWVIDSPEARALMDGERHNLQVSWDSASGQGHVYVDGSLVASSVIATGTVLGLTGEATIGNDIYAGTADSFSGVLHDMRLFDYARSDVQIAAGQASFFNHNEPGLVGYWLFDSMSATGQIGSEAGKHHLVQAQSTQPGAISGFAELISPKVNENSANGTVVGTVQGVDPERDDLLNNLLSNAPRISYSESAGVFLVVGDGRPDWYTAYSLASGMTLNGVNGQLAMPNNPVEDELLINTINDNSLGRTWLAASDATNEGMWMLHVPGEPDVQFSDAAGNSLYGNYVNWSNLEPSAGGGIENHLEMYNHNGEWNDVRYDKASGNYFLAEFDAEEVLDGVAANGSVQRNMTYAIANQTVAGAFAIDAATGEIIVADGSLLNYESAANHVLTIEVQDNIGQTFQRDFTIKLNDVDEASTHSIVGAQTVQEDSSITLTVADNSAVQITDPDVSEQLTLTLTSTNGLMSLSQTTGLTIISGATSDASSMVVSGSVSALNLALDGLTYAPLADVNGVGSIEIETVRSAEYANLSGLKTNSTININIAAVQDEPVALPDAIQLLEGGATATLVGGAATLLDNDTDADSGDVLSAALSTAPTNGTAVIDADGTFSYTHDGSETVSDSFDYTVSDSAGNTSTTTVSITITPVNDTPVAVDDTLFVLEGGTATGGLLDNDTDAELGPLSIIANTDPQYGSVNIFPDSSVLYTHDGSETTSDSFAYLVSDTDGAISMATVNVVITPVNDIPVAQPDSITVDEGGTRTILDSGFNSVLHNDTDEEDGVVSAATVITQPVNGTVTMQSDGTFSYTHSGSETLSDSFTYVAVDADLENSVQTTVLITVNPVNDAPIVSDDLLVVDEAGAASIEVLLNDSDNELDPLSVQIAQAPLNGTAIVNTDNSITYVHDGSETTADSFVYSVSDGNGGTNTGTVTVAVNSLNDAPQAMADSLTVDEGEIGFVDVTLNDTDAENDALTPLLVVQPTHGTVILNADNTFSYIHDGSETLADSFTYVVTDAEGGVSSEATVTIDIVPVNDIPVAQADLAIVDEAGSVAITVLSNDTDNDADVLRAQLLTGPSSGSVILNADNTFTYTHDGSETSGDSFTYGVTDGNGGSATAAVSVLINAVNDVPIAQADVGIVSEGGSTVLAVLANDSDADGDTLSAVLLSAPTNGAVVLNPDNTFTYTHDGSETVSDQFRYQISDTGGGVSTANVSITVQALNDAPIAVDDTLVLDEAGIASVAVLSNDTDAEGSLLLPIVTVQPQYGSASVNPDQSISYQHDGSENFTDQFEYTVFDDNGAAATALVLVQINSVNDELPIFASDPMQFQILENALPDSVVGTVIARDGDADDSLTYLLTDNADGRFQLSADGVLSVLDGSLLNREVDAVHELVVLATDLAGNATQGLIRITVLDETESITDLIGAPAYQVSEFTDNGAVLGLVNAVSGDDSGVISYGLQDSAGGRFAVDAVTGELSVNDASLLDHEINASHIIVVTATDATGVVISREFTVNIQNVNEAPILTNPGAPLTISENVATSSSVGFVTATDPDNDSLQYAISAGNNANAFGIDTSTGELFVSNAAFIDHETQAQYRLVVSATDPSGLFHSTDVLVNVANIDEASSVFNPINLIEYVENSSPVLIAPMVSISDVDSAQLVSVEVSLSNYQQQEDRLSVLDTENIVSKFDETTGRLMLVGPATVDEFNAVLQQIQYTNLSEHPNTDMRILNIAINDGSNSVSHRLVELQIIAMNDPLVGLPLITGELVIGGMLVADVSAMVDNDEIERYHYQWMRDGVDIAGERGTSYNLTASDAGSLLSLKVSVVDSTGRLEPWMLSSTVIIPVPEIPVPEIVPELGAAITDIALTTNDIVFNPVEAESIASVLSAYDATRPTAVQSFEQEATQTTTEQSESALESSTDGQEAEQSFGARSIEEIVVALPDVVSAVAIERLQLAKNNLDTAEINTVNREIKLDAIQPEEQLASVLSLDSLELKLDKESRIVWQVENVGLANSLDEVSENLKQAVEKKQILGSASEVLVGASLSITAGFLVWMLRGGALLASVFSVSPLWKQLDPLPIVNAKSGVDDDMDTAENDVEKLFTKK